MDTFIIGYDEDGFVGGARSSGEVSNGNVTGDKQQSFVFVCESIVSVISTFEQAYDTNEFPLVCNIMDV